MKIENNTLTLTDYLNLISINREDISEKIVIKNCKILNVFAKNLKALICDSSIEMHHCDIIDCNLPSVQLICCKLVNTRLHHCIISDNSKLLRCNMKHCVARYSDFKISNIFRSTLQECDLDRCNVLHDTIMINCDVSNSKISNNSRKYIKDCSGNIRVDE